MNDPANFRPISNLCTFSKLLERLALARLQPHVVNTGNFCPLQSAYRTGHSTETALLKVADDIERAAGKGKCTVLLSLDVSAAFDAIDLGILCDRAVTDFGLTGLAVSWLKSFVTDRTQCIAVGTELSPTTACLSGVPQGSVLGPLLFSMYVSPVGDVINAHGLQYHQYADDLQLYTAVRADDFQDLSHVESCVADVSRWFLKNSLLLNPTKTEAVVFGTRPRLRSIDLSQHLNIEGASIQIADSVRLLGVTLDQTLSFDQHVSEVVRSCNYHLRALRHIRPRLTMECAKSVATSIVGSRLDYCNSLLHGMTQKNFSRLQTVQNNLARAVCQASWTADAVELRRSLHWLPIRQRTTYKLAVITYKACTNNTPPYLSSTIEKLVPARTLRSSVALQLRPPKAAKSATVFEGRAFSMAAPAIWNALTHDIRNAQSLNVFKTRLKTYLFAAAYTHV